MTKKFNRLCIFFLLVVLLMAAFFIKQLVISNFFPQGNTQNASEARYPKSKVFQVKDIQLKKAASFNSFPSERAMLEKFIAEKMNYNGLVTVNLADSATDSNQNQTQLPSGSDILSESVGLLMLYYLETDQEEAFRVQYQQAKKTLQKENGLFNWCLKKVPSTSSNASVDDLRILKALIMANDQWHESNYLNEASTISKGLLTYCVKDSQLLSFDHPDAPYAELFYLDFKAMYLAQQLDVRWAEVLNNALNKTMGLIDSKQPLWVKLDAAKDAYPLTENLLIYLHLTEVGYSNPNLNQWLLDHIETSGLFGSYNAMGVAITKIESPSIYGIAAGIAKNSNDPSLYQASCKKLKQMQQPQASAYFGGFVDLAHKKAYSFDQLWGLLGY